MTDDQRAHADAEDIMQTEEMLHDRGGIEGASITGPGEPLTDGSGVADDAAPSDADGDAEG